MKTLTAITAATLAAALSHPAMASPREYSRGYYDCLAGRYDQDTDSRSYRQGCRDAERERDDDEGMPPPGHRPPPPPGWGGPPPQGWGPNGGGGGGPRPPGWGGGPPPSGWGPNGGGGGPPFVRPGPPPNVLGMGAGQALAALAASGYRNVGSGFAGGAVLGVYFNPATQDCIETAALNGRIVNARKTQDRRCR